MLDGKALTHPCLPQLALQLGGSRRRSPRGHFSLELLKRTSFLTAPLWIIIVVALPLPPVAFLGGKVLRPNLAR